MLRRCPVILAIVGSLTACASTSTPDVSSTERLVALQTSQLPLPPGINPENDIRPYILGPQDKVSISVFGEEGLNTPSIIVNGGGRVDLPGVGEIDAQGRTTSDLAREIEARLTPIVRRPQVSVNIVEPVSQRVTLDGSIARPGLYPVIGRTTLQQIVAQGGSTTEYSRLDRVVIMRKIEGQTLLALYNLKHIRSGKYRDPEVFAGDTVLVGDSAARRWFKDILTAMPLVYLLVK